VPLVPLARGMDVRRGLYLGELGCILEMGYFVLSFRGFKLMSISFGRLPDLVIPNTGTDSNVIANAEVEDAVALIITAPDTLDAFTFTIEIRRWAAATFVTMQEGDIGAALADLKPPAAGKAVTFDMKRIGLSAVHSFRIHVSAAVAAERTFEVTKLWEGN